MIEVAGSLWSVSPEAQLATALRLKREGLRRLHWDMTDGRLATEGGFTSSRAASLAAETGLAAEAHLMSVRSAHIVDAWTEFCDVVIVHRESDDWREAVARIERRGVRAGLAISPGTPASSVPDECDVLCMSIVPGQAGSAFDEGVLAKISALRLAGPDRRIGVDGGVRRTHVATLVEAGADWAVVGTDLVFGTDGAWREVLGAGRVDDDG